MAKAMCLAQRVETVPAPCVGTHLLTLSVIYLDAERPGRGYHAERGNHQGIRNPVALNDTP